jgi:parvulin-like peptidyl-prolyl isomerase
MMQNIQRSCLLVLSVVCLSSFCFAQESQPQPQPQNPEQIADSVLLVTIDGESLTYGQAKVLVENRLAPDEVSAINRWMDIQLKYKQALERKLDQNPDTLFMIDMIKKHFLSFKLDTAVAESAPEITEEQAMAEYDKNISRYTQAMNASVQHITVTERDLGEKIIEEAKRPGTDFDALVEKYSQAKDKANKGIIDRLNSVTCKRQLGDETAEALNNAKTNDILGPFIGIKGFEVIKVTSIKPEEVMEFAKVKDGIIQGLKAQAGEEAKNALMEEIKAKAKIDKSPEMLKLEEEAQKKQEEARKKAEEARKNAKPKAGMSGR